MLPTMINMSTGIKGKRNNKVNKDLIQWNAILTKSPWPSWASICKVFKSICGKFHFKGNSPYTEELIHEKGQSFSSVSEMGSSTGCVFGWARDHCSSAFKWLETDTECPC